MIAGDHGGGRFLEECDRGQPRIVISTKLAAEFPDRQGRPRKVGDELRIGDRGFTIVGLYNTGSLLLDSTIVMDIDAARQLLNVKKETVSCFLVEPDDPARVDAVAAAIEQAIPGVDARTMSDFRAGVGNLLGTIDFLLLLIISLALLVGSVGILNTMLMSTTERFTEFGILRTNGWSRGEVLQLVLAESICLGLLAGAARLSSGSRRCDGGQSFPEARPATRPDPRPPPDGSCLGRGPGHPGRPLPRLARLPPPPHGDHPPGLAVSRTELIPVIIP